MHSASEASAQVSSAAAGTAARANRLPPFPEAHSFGHVPGVIEEAASAYAAHSTQHCTLGQHSPLFRGESAPEYSTVWLFSGKAGADSGVIKPQMRLALM